MAWLGLLLTIGACTPSPRHVACSNDGMCADRDARFHYCLEAHCVECVGSASCGEGRICDDGACACSSDRGCAADERCSDGACASR
jgi:hypothetical protein